MMDALVGTINDVQEVLVICPCCGEIFRLVEGKFIFPKKPPRPSEYLKLVALENRVSNQDKALTAAEDKFSNLLEKQREQLIAAGRERAKKKLKKIDPTFSAKNIDPGDVKVIFNPVEYIIFHGLTSAEGVTNLEFVSRIPKSKAQEKILTSVEKVIRDGNVGFETLRMNDNGTFEIQKA